MHRILVYSFFVAYSFLRAKIYSPITIFPIRESLYGSVFEAYSYLPETDPLIIDQPRLLKALIAVLQRTSLLPSKVKTNGLSNDFSW